MDVQKLIEQGADKLAAFRDAKTESVLLAQKEREDVARQADMAFQKLALKWLPGVLHPYVCFTKGERQHCEIQAPDCAPITVAFRGDSLWRYFIQVPREGLQRKWDEPGLEICYHDKEINGTEGLDIVLAVAREAYVKEQELLIEIQEDEKTQAKVTERMAAKNAERARARAEQEATEQKEKDDIAALLESDPVAAALVRVFAAIQKERDAWEEQIETMGDYADRAAERQAERITRAEQAAENAQRQASDAAHKAQQAEDRIYDLERKAKRGR